MSHKLYTLGTSQRSSEDFIEILLSFSINAVIDVRSFPKSKHPHFNKDALSQLLSSNGLAYYFLGKELGGFRKGGYTAYIITDYFSRGIDALEVIARKDLSVIICAERLPWKCHRKWISGELQKRGWTVEHIINKDKVWSPQKRD
ncbi:MAG: DUF488 domain-containing protein [Nitrospiraceae bacterium]|jgi:uncharacterized protein (DUF488 family)|nr:MAG: DUF488 domain-containing protein [Nitrospiraceae bacterium]